MSALRELRLIPLALVAWTVTWCVCILPHGFVWAVVTIGVGCVVVLCSSARGQAVVIAVGGSIYAMVARWRAHLLGTHPLRHAHSVEGTVLRSVEFGGSGSSPQCLTRLRVSGYPAEFPVFHACDAWEPHVGENAQLGVRVSESKHGLSVGRLVAVRQREPPDGWQGMVTELRERFTELVGHTVGERSRGLIPGMVLGDTSAQGREEIDHYLATGLSHLSAVSGANVAIITTAALIFVRACGASPKLQVAGALLALVGFVGLVGPEPSVQRAAITGLVGLVAMLTCSHTEPLHALAVAICGLLLWDSQLAVSYGFALSCAATAGIVALHPYVYPRLARLRLPDVLTRALSVAIAADVVTQPIVALMAGRLSLVAVAANVAVSAAVTPVTVLGMLAVVLVAVHADPLAAVLLRIIEPCTWFIYTVARAFAQLPWATIEFEIGFRSIVGVILLACWMLYGLPPPRRVAR